LANEQNINNITIINSSYGQTGFYFPTCTKPQRVLQNSEKTPRFARFFFGTLPSRSALAEIIKQQHNKQLTDNNGKAEFHKTSNITFTW